MPINGAKRALDLYAASRVMTDTPPDVHDFNASTDICVTSQLVRAIDSARSLGIRESMAADVFNESQLPYPNRLFVPLPWGLFLLIYRLLWFTGFRQNCTGKLMDRKRAQEGASYLSQLASENRLVLLVGHGIMNRLICSELTDSGWRIDSKTGSGYWSAINLSR